MRAVLVGCGAQSAIWVDSLPPGWEIVGFVDLDLAAAERLAGRSGAATATDLAEMLRRIRPDVVFDCTVPAAHPVVTMTALAAGCHVLGEKPMAETLDDALRMVAAAEASGRVYAVSQNYRFEPGARAMRRMLAELGTLTTLHGDFFAGPRFGGFRDAMTHPLLGDMAIHTFDTARFLLGADPISVYCHEWNPTGSWYAGGASAVCVFEMSGGAVFTYRGSWCAEGLGTSWNAQWRAIGDRGTVTWDGADRLVGEVVAETGGWLSEPRTLEPPAPAPGAADDVRAVLADFAAALAAGTAPESVCTDNVKSLAMTAAAIESARTGALLPVEV